MEIHWLRKIKFLSVFGAFMMIASLTAHAQDGQDLFKKNCAACHKPDKPSTGPALKGARERWQEAGEGDMIYDWISNPQELINSGKSKRALEIKDFSPTAMTPMGYLSKEQMNLILDYADSYEPPKQAAATPTGATPGAGTPEDGGNVFLWIGLFIIIVLVVFMVSLGVKKELLHLSNQQEGVEEIEKPFKQKAGEWIVRNWVLTLLIFLFVVVTGGADLFVRLADVGVFQDYQPSQPIAYSHKLHAGDMGIECRYCHNSAEKSKSAGIPTTNVCMNCHRMITEGKTTGTAEIAKILAAAGYDPEKRDYNRDEKGNIIEGKPIVWNKAHNLPDHVFFSHAQHVNPNAGNIDCRQCHGPVQTYTLGRVSTIDEINAYAKENSKIIPLTKPLLTMGWCIECHNTKTVDLTQNAYYEELHKRLENRPDVLRKILEDDKVTEKELGGWECAKCHY